MKLTSASFQIHRWLGLAFGLFGLMWFASVVPMSLFPYWFRPNPTIRMNAYGRPLTPDMLEDYAAVPERSPAGEAIKTASLYRIDDRLTWRLELVPRGTVLVDAATGRQRGLLTPDEAGRIGQRALGHYADVQHVEQIRDYKFFYSSSRARPIPPYLVRLNDANQTEFVLDASTGDLESIMGPWERVYRVGRAPHILSIPPFDTREGLSRAFQLVALSGLSVSTIAGFIYGVWLLNARRGTGPRRWTSRWVVANVHTWLGVALVLVVLSWVGSGFVMVLSDSALAPTAGEATRLTGEPLHSREFTLSPARALRALNAAGRPPVVLMRASRFLDQPVYEAMHPDGHSTLVHAATGQLLSPLSDDAVRATAVRFAGDGARVKAIDYLTSYDTYYNKMKKTDPLLLPVYRVEYESSAGSKPSAIYVDVTSGQVLGRVDRAYWFYRWFGRALHTFDFPWLLAHPNVRVAAVAIPGVGGTILAGTGLWLGVLYLLRLLPWRKQRLVIRGLTVPRSAQIQSGEVQ